MYRSYEDSRALEKQLAEAQARLAQNPDDDDLMFAVDELKQRINHAWQDEYDD